MLNDQKSELLDICLPGDETTVEPRLDFNRPFEEMRPYLTEHELKKHMLVKLVK